MATARLEPLEDGGVRVLTDPRARAAGVLVAFSDRHGGTSRPPFDTLNLAARVGDERARVEANRARVARAAGFPRAALALARQVHGREIVEVRRGGTGVVGEADGLVVGEPGPVAAILTADCAPVAVADDDAVVLLHAGWRGLAAGIVQAGLSVLGAPRAAWIGPAIRACCYEVGPEVVDAFAAAGLPVAGRRRVDPADAARHALSAAGVPSIALADECTACSPRYFSYRRDGVTGRQGAFAALTPVR